ncbi:hypothetical protein E3N88_07292 [Mikania micrantha]|uniref:Peptidyl-prolyl cis-trans isomerase n=1 Tax=Mikania micrantha TaxID=192012 RepID=A0A5N6PSK2_9ASTR|nr:hypothetical protein E3N88_07292 [Mikania micrantha]
MANPKVSFDMTVGGSPTGQIMMELFANIAPKTADNFHTLFIGKNGAGRSGKPLHVIGSSFCCVILNFMCQGDDFTKGMYVAKEIKKVGAGSRAVKIKEPVGFFLAVRIIFKF